MELKCYVKLSESWVSPIPATIIAFVPLAGRHSPKASIRPISGSELTITYSVDALVKLESFEIGKIYQLPMQFVTVVDEWEN